MTCGEWSPWLIPQQEGIYLLNPRCPAEPPREVIVGNTVLQRFMDSIYVPGRMEDLSRDQIQVVNALRLRLAAGGYMSEVHAAVKELFEKALDQFAPETVVEWGCGYDPMNLRVAPESRYIGVDLDPSVIAFQAQFGVEAYLPHDRQLLENFAGRVDAIVSVFVFHFDIPVDHMETMRSLLSPRGIVLANVYRRDVASRVELLDRFLRAGLSSARLDDPRALCEGHEYWLLSESLDRSKLRELLSEFVRELP